MEKQYHIKLSSEDIGKYVILPGDPEDVKRLLNILMNLNLLHQIENIQHIRGLF